MSFHIYISGPITDANNQIDPSKYAMLNAIASDLRKRGYIVTNPAEIARCKESAGWERYNNQHEFKKACIKELIKCDTVYLIVGHQNCDISRFIETLSSQIKLDIVHHRDNIL